MNLKRKAQIKMFETVGVLVVFFFLLAIGSAFYFGAQRAALEREKAQAAEKTAFQIVLKALNMPELDCSFFATQKDNCIDKIKLAKLAELLKNETVMADYFGSFGYSTITVKQIWPWPNAMNKTTLYNITFDKADEVSQSITSLNPILLFNPIENSYDFGVIEVRVYVK